MARRRRSGIRIKPSRRGAFTRKGISVSQGLRSSDPRTRAQANFARMAKRKFKPLGGSPKRRRRRSSSTASRGHHRVSGHTRVTATGRRVRVRGHRRRNPRRR